MQKVAAVAGTSILRGTAGYNVVASTLLDARNHGAEEAHAADQRRGQGEDGDGRTGRVEDQGPSPAYR